MPTYPNWTQVPDDERCKEKDVCVPYDISPEDYMAHVSVLWQEDSPLGPNINLDSSFIVNGYKGRLAGEIRRIGHTIWRRLTPWDYDAYVPARRRLALNPFYSKPLPLP